MLNRAANIRAARSADALIPAPTSGWVQSGNITRAGLDQAEVLDNFFPTAQGAKLRGGCQLYANIGTAIKALFAYSSTVDDLFAATDTGIYDCDRINAGGSAFADLYGLTSGAWSTTQISTSGGQFLWAVNGADHAHYWNGSAWYPITTTNPNNLGYDALTTNFIVGQTVTGGTSGATATILAIVQTSATVGTFRLGTITGTFQDNEAITSATGAATVNGTASAGPTITITGVATNTLTQCWTFKKRVFAIKEDSMSAWYLPVESIGGAMTEIPLGAVFEKGGTLLFGATWSIDSGSGLDDVCVFASNNGEIAVYEGTDPSSSTTWALSGVYRIGRPVDKKAYFKSGGDLAILTDDGIVAISEAIRKDRAALRGSAISSPIEDAWREAVANRSASKPITATLWPSKTMLLVGVPNSVYVANAATGAWCRYTGWDVICSSVAGENLYFGTTSGKVMKAETTGADNGIAYTGVYVPKFSDLGTPAWKSMNLAIATVKSSDNPNFAMFGMGDYSLSYPGNPEPIGQTSGSTWGTGVWGTFVWGSGVSATPKAYRKVIYGQGYSVSVGIMATSNQAAEPAFEIMAMRFRYEIGDAL